jgi:integrase
MTKSKGSGSLYRDTRGYWTAVTPLPAIEGKRRREVFRSRRKSEAESWLADRLPTGDEPDWNNLTVSAWLSYWLCEVATKSPKT